MICPCCARFSPNAFSDPAILVFIAGSSVAGRVSDNSLKRLARSWNTLWFPLLLVGASVGLGPVSSDRAYEGLRNCIAAHAEKTNPLLCIAKILFIAAGVFPNEREAMMM